MKNKNETSTTLTLLRKVRHNSENYFVPCIMLNKNETSNTLTTLTLPFYNMLKRVYCELLELLACFGHRSWNESYK